MSKRDATMRVVTLEAADVGGTWYVSARSRPRASSGQWRGERDGRRGERRTARMSMWDL